MTTRGRKRPGSLGRGLSVLICGIGAFAHGAQAASNPPDPGRTIAEASPPQWPARPKPARNAPNILLIMTDDVGFGSASAFGGPVPAETFEQLARDGLRYNRFNTTALCSPTRAALLTGRNPHNANMGTLTNTPTPFEGYTSVIPGTTATIAQILSRQGYATAAFGKWHLTPEWEMSEIGPFDRWPTGMGFDYFYGFLAGSTSQFTPALYENTIAVDPPRDDPGYILDQDLADHAIRWIAEQRAIAPDRPFLAYYATGTAHGPHHAPKKWLERFRGRFDDGWDAMREEIFSRQKSLGVIPKDTVLTPRPDSLPAWSSLSDDQKRLAARFMEAYAAALAYGDHQMGRIVQYLKDQGEYENTLIIYIQGDNGSSAEGGISGLIDEMGVVEGVDENLEYQLSMIDKIGTAEAYNAYPAGWGWAMNTPFQYYKQVASHFGGVRNGLVITWPDRINARGAVRSQFHHVSDIAPTILEAAQIEAPEVLNGTQQRPMDGISMVYSFDAPTAPSRRRTQLFAMVQNLGIYHDGWWAGTRPAKAPWELLKPGKVDLDQRVWELYDLRSDFSQSRDLAAARPDKLKTMQELFWAAAGQGHVLPLHDSSEAAANRPSLTAGRTSFTYRPGITRIPENTAPPTLGNSFAITAEIEAGDSPAHGVLATHGGRFGGYAFYVKDGSLRFHYNTVAERQYHIVADKALPANARVLEARFEADSRRRGTGGTLTLLVDGRVAGRGRIEATLKNWISLSEGLDIGEDTLSTVTDDYSLAESRFNGTLKSVRIDIK